MCVRKIVVRSFQRCAQSNAVAPYCFVPPPIHCGTNALSSVRKLISGACYEMFLCCRRGDRRQTRSSVYREAHDASRSSSSSGRNNMLLQLLQHDGCLGCIIIQRRVRPGGVMLLSPTPTSAPTAPLVPVWHLCLSALRHSPPARRPAAKTEHRSLI